MPMQWQCNGKFYNIIKVNGEWEWEHRNEMNVCGSGSLCTLRNSLFFFLFFFSNHIRDEARREKTSYIRRNGRAHMLASSRGLTKEKNKY